MATIEENAGLAKEKTAQEKAEQAKEKAEQVLDAAMRKINDNAQEEDVKGSSRMTLREILGGDILSARWIRSQIWLIILIVAFTFVYIAFRYQCQQDLIRINKLETELKDARYKALSTSSELTERCRESHILEMLKQRHDSLLKISDRPPYIIYIEEE